MTGGLHTDVVETTRVEADWRLTRWEERIVNDDGDDQDDDNNEEE